MAPDNKEKSTAAGIFRDEDDTTKDDFDELAKVSPVEVGALEDDDNYGSGFWKVFVRHPQYLTYAISHICMHTGDWFVRIASLVAVETIASESGMDSGKALSYLVLSRLIPHAVFAQAGGALADRFDRRWLMIILDCLAGIVVLFYPLALKNESLTQFYIITVVRNTITALYYPVTTGIVPLLVKNNPSDLKFALTINSIIWSTTAIVGGLVAGAVTKDIGLEGCYYIDCGTFFVSAFVMLMWTAGSYNVYTGEKETGSNCCRESYKVFQDLILYIMTCGFGIMVLVRASGSFAWGMEDILNTEFATANHADGIINEDVQADSALRMGQIYSVSGGGCFVGPMLSNLITDSHFPYTYQRATLIGLAFIVSGWLFTSFVDITANFGLVLVGTFIRTMGSGTVWMNSTLVLQTLSSPGMLGRILAVDFTLTTLMEAASAWIAGAFSESGWNVKHLSLFGMSVGFFMLLVWSAVYCLQLGAANPKFNQGSVKSKTIGDDKDGNESLTGSNTGLSKEV